MGRHIPPCCHPSPQKSLRFQRSPPKCKTMWRGSTKNQSTNAKSKQDLDLESHLGKVQDEPERKRSPQSRRKRAANFPSLVHCNQKRSRCRGRSGMNFVASTAIQAGPKNFICGQPQNDKNNQSSSSKDDASSDSLH